MSKRNTFARILIAAALALALAAPSAARGRASGDAPDAGLVFEWLDPGREVRDAVDPGVAARLSNQIRVRTPSGRVWTETMYAALAVMSSELTDLEARGRLDDDSRPAIAALAALSVVDVVVDAHPELAPVVQRVAATRESSPIERICNCDRSGSRACGCAVNSTGAGACEYRVLCPGLPQGFCSAVNVELCLADVVTDILF